MQLLPTNSPVLPGVEDTTNAVERAAEQARKAARDAAGRDFESVYSSFIEEGRERYTGLPNGFSALVQEGGTISRQQTDIFKDELRKRNVHDASLLCLDQLLASGQAISVGKIFSLLGGDGQTIDPLSETEKNDFTQFMQKLGINKEQAGDLLYMAENGQASKAWQKISKQMQNLGEGEFELHQDELKATMKALGISQDAQKISRNILKQMADSEIAPEDLAKVFAEVDREIAAKTEASKLVQGVMREAMNEAIHAAKLRAKSEPVADTRGSQASINIEARMRKTLSEKALHLDAASAAEEELNNRVMQARNAEASALLTKDAARAARNASDFANSEFESTQSHSKSMGDLLAASHNLSGRDHEAAERDMDKRHGRGDQQKNLGNLETAKAAGESSRTSRPQNSTDSTMQDFAAKIAVVNPNTVQPDANLANQPRVQNIHREIFSQIEQGVMQSGPNGANHMTLQVNTGEGTAVTLLLTVQNGEVRATLRTDSPEEASLLAERLGELKSSLEESGLKVAQLDVETKLGEENSFGQWDGTNEHNLMRDAQERARMTRLNSLRREEGLSTTPDQAAGLIPQQAQGTGLNIVA